MWKYLTKFSQAVKNGGVHRYLNENKTKSYVCLDAKLFEQRRPVRKELQ
ncbi:hypothetical protein FLLO111716_09905 [Flavobacterium longum]